MAAGDLDAGDRDVRRNGGGSTKVASTINIIAGIWLIISPFVLRYWHIRAAAWDNIICGIVVLVLASIRVAHPARNLALSWINLIIGIWIFISPWVLRYSTDRTPLSNDVVLGIIVFVCAIWSLAASPRSDYRTPPPYSP
jgi:uncharacterized membrane protein HdeD (DUF308 family)